MLKAFNYIKKYNPFNEKRVISAKYQVIAHEENYEGTGKIYVKVRMNGTRNAFYKPVGDLYKSEWIEDFSHEDSAFIAVLYLSEKQKAPEIVPLFPRKKQHLTRNVIILGMLFVSFLILSNLTASKIVELNLKILPFWPSFTLEFPAALIFFPVTYFLDDTLTEVYGFKVSRYIIWGGLFCNSLVSLGIFFSIILKPAHFWDYQQEYALILSSTYRVFLASIIGTFFGEFCNAVILSKIKILTSGKWLWFRVITSSSCGVAIDSLLFCVIAFYGSLSNSTIINMILTQYIFKVGYELCALPVTYFITGYLKKRDKVDYYDYGTNFNPFSLKLL